LPLPRHRRSRNGQQFGDLALGQTAEVAQLDDPALPRIEDEQLFEGGLQQQDLASGRPHRADAVVEGDAQRGLRAFLCPAPAGAVDEDAPHDLRRHPEEMRAVLPGHTALSDQPEIRLIHQRRWLQRVVRPLVTQVGRRTPPQLLIYQRQQVVACLEVAVPPRTKQRAALGRHASPTLRPRVSGVNRRQA
jgi:hypothetical protein